jgi:ankyrin repeat protein
MDKEGFAPIHVAVSRSSYDLVEILLAAHANPNQIQAPTRLEVYWSPIHLAAKLAVEDIMKLLLDNRGDVSNVNGKGVTALHIAASESREKIVDLLIARGAQIDAKDEDGEVPLFGAVRSHSIAIVHTLCTPGTVSAPSKSMNTPLHIAASLGFADIAKFLQENKADVGAANSDGNTPLHLAVIHKRKACVDFLLRSGADVLTRNKQHKSAFTLASGPLVQVMKQHMDRHPESVKPLSAEKFDRSTKAAPSKFRSTQSSTGVKAAPSRKQPVKKPTQTKKSEADTAPDTETADGVQKQIEADLTDFQQSIRGRLDAIHQLIEQINSEFGALAE